LLRPVEENGLEEHQCRPLYRRAAWRVDGWSFQ
jgi:hypothetical protein